jgi:hypothetical protein
MEENDLHPTQSLMLGFNLSLLYWFFFDPPTTPDRAPK